MGGPAKQADVAPFLFNLFSDREIIKLGPPFLQKLIAWFISRKRSKKSRNIYAKIGGGSPLLAISRDQAAALGQSLAGENNYIVTVAMRYWAPFAHEVVEELVEQGVDSIIALPLYPHFSKATTGSSLSHLQKSLEKLAPDIPFKMISSYPTQSSYIDAIAENIEKGVQQFNTDDVEIVYSAHSLPISFIEGGDPYVEQINQTIDTLEKITQRKGKLCYQSRSGPVEWLSPSTPEMLEKLAHEGCKNILMVPISFVSDHVETLYEINMLYKEQAKELNMRLIGCESLNTNPLYIRCLKELVLETQSQGQGNC